MEVDKKLIAEAKRKMGERAAHLIVKDLGIKDWDEVSLKGCCPFHEDSTPSFIWDSKSDANYFKCFGGGCGKVYSIVDHYISFYKLTYLGALERLFKETETPFRFSEKGLKSKLEYRYPVYKPDDNRDLVEKYLATRKISKETLDKCDVQQYQGKIVFNFYDENDVLLSVKLRPSKTVEKHENKEWFLPNYSNTPILYNMNKVDPSLPLVIVEGPIDCLSVIESGYSNCVSVPAGTENLKWIEECWDWLERFESIIIFGDNDTAGVKMRREVVSRLGDWRTKIVDVPPVEVEDVLGNKHLIKDANDVLIWQGKDIVLTLIDTAEEMPLTGVVNLASIEPFDMETAPGLKTNIEALDKIIYKFFLGNVIVVTGIKGAGKSTLINQLFVCNALQQDYESFIFSGELGGPALQSWIELTMAGPEHVSMKNESVHIIDPEIRKQMLAWYNNKIWLYKDIGNDADHVLDKAITLTRKFGVKIWILDNLLTLNIQANDTNIYQKQTEFVNKLTRLAELYNVLIVLVVHPRKGASNSTTIVSNDVAGASGIGDLAQYIFSVKRISDAEKKGEQNGKGGYKRGKEATDKDVEISILKNRLTGHDGIVKAYFHYDSYRFHTNVKEAFTRYGWDKNKTPLPKEYPPKFINNQPDILED